MLTGYYISRDTIYGPERSGEFYVRGERIYLSRRALAGRARIPGASVREVGRVLGDLAGMPRSTGTVANRIATRDLAPIPTGYFTINGRIYGGLAPGGPSMTQPIQVNPVLATATGTGRGASLLVVLRRDDELARKSLRNAAGIQVITEDQLNTYDVLAADHVVFTAEALETFVNRGSRSEEAAQ